MHASPIAPVTTPLFSSALSANGRRCSLTRTRRALRSSATSRCTSRTIQPTRGANPRCSHSARTACPTRSRESRRIASQPPDRFGAIPPTTGITCAKTDTYGGLPACAARSSCTTACVSITSWASITILRFPQEVPEPMAPGCRDRASSCSSVHSRNSDRCRLSPRTWAFSLPVFAPCLQAAVFPEWMFWSSRTMTSASKSGRTMRRSSTPRRTTPRRSSGSVRSRSAPMATSRARVTWRAKSCAMRLTARRRSS